MIIAEIIRALGPTILRSFLGGANNNGGNNGDASVSQGVSPFGDEDEEEDELPSNDSNSSGVSISLPFPDNEEETKESNVSSSTLSTSMIESKEDVTKTANVKTALDDIQTTTIPSETENEVTTKLWPFGQQLGKTLEVMILKNAHGLPEITAHPRLLRHVSPFCVLIVFAVGSHSRESSQLDRLDLEGDPKSLKKGITITAPSGLPRQRTFPLHC